MPRERDPPYVAAGFRTDAWNLLDRFVGKQSLIFADFAKEWCDLQFATIFMGREGLRELTEFIEECYRNTLLFMDASNPYQKVGAVYLLYSLYLKQPHLLLKSRIPIRVSYNQVSDIRNLENHFLDVACDNNDALDLTFIVTKLFQKGAFDIFCLPIPMGPAVPIPLLRLEPLRNSFFKEMLGVLRMLNECEVKSICEMFEIHEELKKQLPCLCSNASKSVTGGLNKFEELKEVIDELEYRYNAGLFPNKETSGDVKIEEEFRSLGQRRAFLKSQQYERVAEFRRTKRIRPSSDSSESSPPTPVKKRGPGRPKKKKQHKRGRKKKVVEVVANTESGAETEKGFVTVETEADDLQTEAEIVDNPRAPRRSGPLFPYRRPSKYPRPIRRLYFQNKGDEGEES